MSFIALIMPLDIFTWRYKSLDSLALVFFQTKDTPWYYKIISNTKIDGCFGEKNTIKS